MNSSDCPYGPLLGEHAAEIRNLKEDVHAIREGQEKMLICLTRIDRTMAEQRAEMRIGKKVLAWLATAAVTAGGIVTAVVQRLLGGEGP